MFDFHGGKIYSYKNILDFSSNINPLGTPEGVKRALTEALTGIEAYPDINCLNLRRSIARHRQVDSECVICGNGATELIYSLIRALKPKKALLALPSFAEYEAALMAIECEIIYYDTRDKDFVLESAYLDYINSEIDLLILGNPGNPVGQIIELCLLEQIIDRCRACGTYVLLDECFMDFVEEEPSVLFHDNVFQLYSFTKMYAIPGVRVGYGICKNLELLEKMYLNLPAWNVSSLAQSGAAACLQESEFVKRSREYIDRERELLQRGLKELGFRCYSSQANFLFFKAEDLDLYDKMLKKGILIRDCSNYRGLEKGYYRVAVKGHEDNLRLLEVFSSLY